MNRKDNSFDEAFDMLLTEAAIQADKNIGAKLQIPEENIIFSEEHEQKMRKLFKHEQQKLFRKKLVRYSMRSACILLLVAVLTFVSLFSVSAWRVKFLNFVMEFGEPNTDYHLDGGETGSYSEDDINIVYIPNGFAVVENIRDGDHIFLEFKNQEQYFTLTIESVNVLSNIDTEEVFIEKLTLNGIDTIFVDKDSVKTLIWSDDKHSYTVYGNISKNELIKIAKDVLIGQK